MTGCDVWVFEENTLRQVVRKANEELAAKFPDYETRMLALNSHDEKQSLWSEWEALKEKTVTDKIHDEVIIEPFDTRKDFRGLCQHSVTDYQGQFKFVLPKKGTYSVVATGQREIIGESEQYFWLVVGPIDSDRHVVIDNNYEIRGQLGIPHGLSTGFAWVQCLQIYFGLRDDKLEFY